jgi:hypothetical protein
MVQAMPFGRHREPPTRLEIVLRICMAAACLSILPLVRLATGTVGTLTLLADSAAVGFLVLGLLASRLLRYSATYREYRRSRPAEAWAGRAIVCFVIAVFPYDALLTANGAFLGAASYTTQAVITARAHGTGRYRHSFHLNIFSPDVGRRELNATEDVWNSLAGDSSLLLILKHGRLGFPVIVGYRRLPPVP